MKSHWFSFAIGSKDFGATQGVNVSHPYPYGDWHVSSHFKLSILLLTTLIGTVLFFLKTVYKTVTTFRFINTFTVLFQTVRFSFSNISDCRSKEVDMWKTNQKKKILRHLLWYFSQSLLMTQVLLKPFYIYNFGYTFKGQRNWCTFAKENSLIPKHKLSELYQCDRVKVGHPPYPSWTQNKNKKSKSTSTHHGLKVLILDKLFSLVLIFLTVKNSQLSKSSLQMT